MVVPVLLVTRHLAPTMPETWHRHGGESLKYSLVHQSVIVLLGTAGSSQRRVFRNPVATF